MTENPVWNVCDSIKTKLFIPQSLDHCADDINLDYQGMTISSLWTSSSPYDKIKSLCKISVYYQYFKVLGKVQKVKNADNYYCHTNISLFISLFCLFFLQITVGGKKCNSCTTISTNFILLMSHPGYKPYSVIQHLRKALNSCKHFKSVPNTHAITCRNREPGLLTSVCPSMCGVRN